jgi:hypothetical protein
LLKMARLSKANSLGSVYQPSGMSTSLDTSWAEGGTSDGGNSREIRGLDVVTVGLSTVLCCLYLAASTEMMTKSKNAAAGMVNGTSCGTYMLNEGSK